MKTLFSLAILCLAATSYAQEGVVKDPAGQEWKLSVGKAPGGESVNLSRMVGGKPKFIATVYPAERAAMVQQLDQAISQAKTAAAQKSAAGSKVPVAGKHNVVVEVDAQGAAGVVFGRTRLSIEEAAALRDCLAKLDGYVAQVKR